MSIAMRRLKRSRYLSLYITLIILQIGENYRRLEMELHRFAFSRSSAVLLTFLSDRLFKVHNRRGSCP